MEDHSVRSRCSIMSTRTLRTAETRASVTAMIAGSNAELRRRATRALARDGFRIAHELAHDAAGTIIVHCGSRLESAGLRALRELRDQCPRCPVIAVMPAGSPNATLRRVLLTGALGIVFETELDSVLVPTANAVLSGQLTVPRALGRQVAPQPLSHREKQILGLVMRGYTNREIAQELFLAESTVKTHLSSAFRKIDARSRSEAVAKIQDPETGFGAHILQVDASGASSV
jgi:DNA-binding NarL/FixJ family response regulator